MSTIPHSISNETAPVTKGAEKLVPVNGPYPPLILVVTIFTPGATKSGFTYTLVLVYPLPEKSAIAFNLELYAPTEITFLAVEGSVNVVSMLGILNAVSLETSSVVGSQMLNLPSTMFIPLILILQFPGGNSIAGT